MKNNNVRPNLLLAGFQKCGSSSLFDILNKHPNILGTKPKETFALTDKSYQNYSEKTSWDNPDFEWASFFPDVTDDSDIKIYMEASVCNFYQQKALNYVREYPGTKVIFIIRDPVQRFVSTYRYYGGYGVHLKPGTTLEEYYRISMGKQHNHEAMNYSLEHGKYGEYIETWKKTVGDDNILVIGLTKIIHEKKDTLTKIFKFLDVEQFTDFELPHKNETTVNRFPWINRAVVSVFGGFELSSTKIGKLYKKMMAKQPSDTELSKSLENRLREYYSDVYEQYGQYF